MGHLNESAFQLALTRARTIQEETGFLPAVDDPRLKGGEVLLWLPIEGDDPLDELIAKGKGGDPLERAVAAAALHSLMNGNPVDGFETVRTALQRLATALPVERVVDVAQLRWELHLAASADSLDRAVRVGRRFLDLQSTPEMLALAARTLFLLAHPSRSSLDVFQPSTLDPEIRQPGWPAAELCDLFTYVLATTVEKRGSLAWTDPAALSTAVLNAVMDTEHLLRRVQSTGTLTPAQRAIQYWCMFALAGASHDRDKMNDAGRGYAALPPYVVDGEGTQHILSGSPAAATCFALAANWSGASEAAKRWATEAPKNAQAMRRLAEAHYKQHEIPEATRAYEAYVRLKDGDDEDWESSLLLHLGLEVHQLRDSSAALEAAAFSASIRPQAERLIAWAYPWFDALSSKARERWWVGMFILTSPHVAAEIGAARWDQAADAFGETVAFELKDRVFRLFAESSPASPPDERWQRVLSGRGMLGQMIECLLQTREPMHPTAKQLSGWLTTNHSQLRDHIRRRGPKRLLRLARLRGQAQHGSVTEAETREVFLEAADLLNALVGK